MNHKKNHPEFKGYDHFIVGLNEQIPAPLPKRIKVIDVGRFIEVDLDRLELPSDASGDISIRLREHAKCLTNATGEIFYYVMLHALNGKRKVSTVKRWVNEFSLFTRTVREHVPGPIATITFAMFNWYSSQKSGSQQKLLRSVLKYWMELKVPGVELELQNYLAVSKAPKPRSTIEIQNTTEHERPFSFEQIRKILSNIDDLYISGQFNPQENLLWRLIVSEAMRPSQMHLLQVGDITIEKDKAGKVVQINMNVPIVKQQATPARRYMMEYRLSSAVARALSEHLNYLETLLGHTPPPTQPLFSIVRLRDGTSMAKETAIHIIGLITRTRIQIAGESNELDDFDLFTRRFKHTKLTHLAMLGAPLEVLARAGFQTSTVSLKHYVNLSEEAFVQYEELLSKQYDEILFAFKGEIINRDDATHTDRYHAILDTNMQKDVGSCATNPCNVFAPIGCYVCPRFEAFNDGPHEVVLSFLLERKERARRLKLSAESLTRDDHLISAVQNVIADIKKKRMNDAA